MFTVDEAALNIIRHFKLEDEEHEWPEAKICDPEGYYTGAVSTELYMLLVSLATALKREGKLRDDRRTNRVAR